MIRIDTQLKSISRILPKYAKLFEKIGLFTVRDLLFYFPFRYDDYSNIAAADEHHVGEIITAIVRIESIKTIRTWKKKMTVTEAVANGENDAKIKLIWFRQPHLEQMMRPGMTFRISGKLLTEGKNFQMTQPAWERSEREETNTGRLVPVYPETQGLTSKYLRWQIKTFLPLAKSIPDPIEKNILSKYHLPGITNTLSEIHFPTSQENLVRAQKRISYQEMLLVQLKSQWIKKQWEQNSSVQINFDKNMIKNFVSDLPFKLTGAQRKSSFEILRDLEKTRPMNRLLNGDVGSGKTVVAAISAFQAISAGFQTAIMAPTEVLSRQHFFSLLKLFKNYNLEIGLMTSAYKMTSVKNSIGGISENQTKRIERNNMLSEIQSGKINLLVGTHALIQKDVRFKNLALVIIDEQHRFGVAQRAALQQEAMSIHDGRKKTTPHLLTMTATPIPRTLAIAFFGSLDISILDEMPKNRLPIITKTVGSLGREKVYGFIRSEIKKGRQAFVIFPLVEESEKLSEIKAATDEHKKLQKIFSDIPIGLIHGRMKPAEKEKAMQDFKDNKFQILVSTSVVEVGIDVPNATVMVIENAERFGLAQLHQFRGRVGRGEHQSYCFLFSKGVSGRLKALEKTNDGFEIAKMDLDLRGPGQFFGHFQSGLPDISMESLTNMKLIKFASEDAKKILDEDPELKKHPLLADAFQKFSEKIHLE